MRGTIFIIFCLSAIAIISGYENNAEEEALTDIIQLLNDKSGGEIGPLYKKAPTLWNRMNKRGPNFWDRMNKRGGPNFWDRMNKRGGP
eukprot:09797.XXX_25864_26189_1 [CDS] Oithona nana genome sequencing.